MNHTALIEDTKNSGDETPSTSQVNHKKRKRSDASQEELPEDSPSKKPRLALRMAKFVPNARGGQSIIFGDFIFQRDKAMTKTTYSDSNL